MSTKRLGLIRQWLERGYILEVQRGRGVTCSWLKSGGIYYEYTEKRGSPVSGERGYILAVRGRGVTCMYASLISMVRERGYILGVNGERGVTCMYASPISAQILAMVQAH